MKISTKGRYGLRAMVDLAANSDGEYMSLKTIAERQSISENYLEQVFSTLRKARVIKSVKGAQGGYSLSEEPSRITVGRILRALEGELAVIDEEAETCSAGNDEIQSCIKTNVWDKINDSINSVVDSITVEELVAEYNKMQDTQTLMYYI